MNLCAVIFTTIVLAILVGSFKSNCEQKSKHSLQLPYYINVHESIFESNGSKFRRIVYQGQIFTLKLLTPEATSKDIYFSCNDPSKGNIDLPNQITLSVKMTKRSSFFMDGLRTTCKDVNGKRKIEIDPNIRIGFGLDGIDSKHILQNKKLYWKPFQNQIGFGADW